MACKMSSARADDEQVKFAIICLQQKLEETRQAIAKLQDMRAAAAAAGNAAQRSTSLVTSKR